MNLVSDNYQEILLQIQKEIKKTKEDILQAANEQKVVMCWRVGKVIDQHLLQNDRAEYGKKFFAQLAQDVKIAERTIYQMRAFYKTYPQLPQSTKILTWTHYRDLIAVKNPEKRQFLEDLTLENALGTKDLQKEISKVQAQSKATKIRKNPHKKLRLNRGKILTYKITEDGGADLGFNILLKREFLTYLGLSPLGAKTPEILHFVQDDGLLEVQDENILGNQNGEAVSQNSDPKYGIKAGKWRTLPKVEKPTHTYKAELERVVDGDTIRVILDLGFGITHREILRLSQINAPESATKEGKRSTKELKEILKNVPFLIVKTNKTDIYGRYVADVFFAENNEENNVQKIADSGTYLNQLLLDRGLANFWS